MAKQALPEHLRICLVGRNFPGLSKSVGEGYLWPIAKGLARRGHQVTILTTRTKDHFQELKTEGVSAHFLGPISPADTSFSFQKSARIKFAELHREQPFHILHSIDSSGLLIARFKEDFQIAAAFDVKATQISQMFSIVGMAQETVWSVLRTGFALAYKYLRTYFGNDREILSLADGVFVTSPQERIVLERYYYYPDARIHQIPYGIDVGDLTPREESSDLKKKWNLPDDGHVVLTISDMTDLREIRSLLKAFEALAIKKPRARLILAGNGPKRKEIEFQVYNLALGNRVILPGALEQQSLIEALSLSQVFVNLSPRTAPWDPSLLIAMAQKKVIILAELHAESFTIEDGRDGFLVRPADIPSLTKIFLDIFDGQVSASEIGERARKKVTDLFDIQKMIEQTVVAYQKILRQTGFYSKK